MPVTIITGPKTSSVSRTAAEAALQRHPDLPAGAEFELSAHAGQWIAAVHWAGPFDGAPADSEEEAPAPKSEGPDDSAPEPKSDGGDEGGSPDKPSGDDGGESKPPHEKGGEHGGISELKADLQAIADALGVVLPSSGGLGGGMVPGADAGLGPDAGGPPGLGGPPAPPAPPAGGHAGPPAPPHGGGPAGPAGPGGPNQHVIHEKSGPPMPPTFASVPDDHPWADTVGKVGHFRVAGTMVEGQSLVEVEGELRRLADAGGFEIKKIREARDDAGARVAEAIIATPRQ
jgi:hypothetical protein